MLADKFLIGIVIIFAVASLSFARHVTCDSKKKIVLDVDAGADDAIAIIVALETQRLYNGPEIVAITCVNGNADVDNVGMNVLKTLQVVDRLDIPVYKGASHPLVLVTRRDYYFGQDGFGDFYFPNPPSEDLIQKEHAVNALIKLVKKYPGEITLVALGPLTNVALAIRIYPRFLEELKDLIILGGSVEGRGNAGNSLEFNFRADPSANYVVFNSTESKLPILVPWETALRASVPMEFRRSLSELNNAKSRLIDSAETISLNPEKEYWDCADALATMVALTSESFVTKSGIYYSDLIYEGSTSGLILVDYPNITGNPPNTNLIQKINVEVYKKILLRSFSGP